MASSVMDQAAATAATPSVTNTFVYRSAQANAEGWGVFDCGSRQDGTPRIELQRLDTQRDGSPSRFEEDEAAWKHVAEQAWAGSGLHLAALRLIDPVERRVIESVLGWWPDRGDHP